MSQSEQEFPENEREIVKYYRSLSRNQQTDLVPYIATIKQLQKVTTPQENMELKTALVSASIHNGMMRTKTLQLLNRKIEKIKNAHSKQNKELQKQMNQFETQSKIKRANTISHTVRSRRLSRKTRKMPNLSPIKEGSKESKSHSKSNSPLHTMSKR